MIDYVFKDNLFNEGAGKKLAYPVNVKMHTEAEMAEEIASSNIGISDSESTAVIKAMNGIVRKWIRKGEGYNSGLTHIHFSVPGNFGEGETPSEAAIRVTPSKELIVDTKGIALHKVEPGASMYVYEVKDAQTGQINGQITPGGAITIMGYNIKIVGNHPSVGVFFDQLAGGKPIFTVATIVQNDPSQLIVMVPPNMDEEEMTYHLRLVTMYSNGNLLKFPREYICSITLST